MFFSFCSLCGCVGGKKREKENNERALVRKELRRKEKKRGNRFRMSLSLSWWPRKKIETKRNDIQAVSSEENGCSLLSSYEI